MFSLNGKNYLCFKRYKKNSVKAFQTTFRSMLDVKASKQNTSYSLISGLRLFSNHNVQNKIQEETRSTFENNIVRCLV